MKGIIVSELIEAKKYLSKLKYNQELKLKNIEEENKEPNKKKSEELIRNRYRLILINHRIDKNQEIQDYIQTLDFKNNIPQEINDCLSPFGTFFDGKTIYYDETILNQYDSYHQSIIILNEFFNLLQGYYGSGTLPEGQAKKIPCISLLCLYHIGIVREKVLYSQSIRGELIKRFNFTHPNNTIAPLIFEPNKNASKYLYYDLIVNENKTLGTVSNKIETEEVIFCKVCTRYLLIREGCLDDLLNLNNEYSMFAREVYYKKNNKSRTRKGSKITEPIDLAREIANI